MAVYDVYAYVTDGRRTDYLSRVGTVAAPSKDAAVELGQSVYGRMGRVMSAKVAANQMVAAPSDNPPMKKYVRHAKPFDEIGEYERREQGEIESMVDAQWSERRRTSGSNLHRVLWCFVCRPYELFTCRRMIHVVRSGDGKSRFSTRAVQNALQRLRSDEFIERRGDSWRLCERFLRK